jgi:multidrug efflux system membrane fusion protein
MSQTIQPGDRPAPKRRRKRPAWRTIAWIVAVVLVAVLIAFLLSKCAGGGAAGGPGGGRGRASVTVGVAKATTGDIPIILSALGTVTPEATVQVTAQVGGPLSQVNFHEGQLVHKGQVLAVIDPRPYQVAVQQAEGQEARDQALLANARLDLTRYQTLLAQDSISKQQADTQASLVRQDEGVVATDRAAVAAARLNLSYTHIVAPVSGRVGLRQIDPGNLVSANGSSPIVVVTQIDPIDVVFAVPEDSIPSVTSHPNFGAGLAVSAYDRSGGQALAQGVLTTLDNLVDTTTGTVKGKARFANPTGALFPNQFVNVTVLTNTLKNQVIVPTTAIRHGPQGDFVYVLQPGQTVKVRAVTVGPGTDETVSITKGLAAGETVITEGGDRLRDGAKVALPGQRPPGAGGRRRHGGGDGSGGGAPGGGGG